MSDQARWYVVHTYSGYENKVASSIENAVENRKLHDLICEVRVPSETVTEIKDNKKREVERKIFPSYVLIKMVMNDETWYVVRNIRGVTGFVGPGSKPAACTDERSHVSASKRTRSRSTLRLAITFRSSTGILTALSERSPASRRKRGLSA